MDANAWANQYLGQKIADNSGNYKGECVSFIKRYVQEVQAVPNADLALYVPDDKAKNYWLKFNEAGLPKGDLKKYYDKVNVPKVGDIAVYNGGKYGDVAVYIGGGQVAGQLGTPVFKPVAIRPVGSPIGYLRRKEGNMEELKRELENERSVNRTRAGYLTEIALAAGDDADSVERDDVDRIIARLAEYNVLKAENEQLKKGFIEVDKIYIKKGG